MKLPTLAIVSTGLAVLALAAVHAASSAAGGAYYTTAQSTDGAKQYAQSCARCHGAKLEGVSAPALKGSGVKGSQTIGDLYSFLSTQMPAGAPGSLSAKQYTAIMAYILKQNGHPAGNTALTPAKAKAIKEKI